MKKLFLCTILLFSVIAICFGQIKEFKYDSRKMMDVGYFYSYHIKELDGKNEMDFYFYIKDDTTIESFVDFSTVVPQVMFVNGTMNKETCSFERTYGINPFSYTKIGNDTSEMIYDNKKNQVRGKITYYDKKKELKSYSSVKKLELFPAYEMSLYQLDFWFAMRNYQGNYKLFEIGTVYNGATSVSEVKYIGEEVVNGVLCEKWQIQQKGIIAKISNKTQTIWFDKSDNYKKVIKYQNKLNISPVGQLDINFVNRTKITVEEWNNFCDLKTEEARKRLGIPAKQ